jgi:hypothetical protein
MAPDTDVEDGQKRRPDAAPNGESNCCTQGRRDGGLVHTKRGGRGQVKRHPSPAGGSADDQVPGLTRRDE